MKQLFPKLLVAGGLALGSTPQLQAQCTIDKSNWQLVLDEEFNTSLADIKTRWDFKNGPTGHAVQWFTPYDDESNITLDPTNGGVISFNVKKLDTPVTIGGNTYGYSMSNMVSKHDDVPFCSSANNRGYLYGMFEIKCKLPKKSGQANSFWMHGTNSWPPEIDAFESDGRDHNSFFSSVHWADATTQHSSCGNTYHFPYDITDDFHTWTIVWTPTRITWFFDGKELKTDDNMARVPGAPPYSMWSRCQWMKMQMQIGSGLNWPDASETNFDPVLVDYIKVYKPIGDVPFTGNDPNLTFDGWHDNVIKPLYAGTSYKYEYDWNLNRINTATAYRALSDLNVTQGGGKYIYKGAGDLLWTTYWDGYQFNSTPIDWSNTIDGNISVAADTEVPFFRKGSLLSYFQDGQFYYIGSGGTVLNNVQSKILASRDGLNVIYLGTDNNLRLCQRANAASHTWAITAITTSGNATDEVIVNNDDYSVVYFKDTSNRLVRASNNGAGWLSAVISNGVNDVNSSLVINAAGDKLYYKNFTNNIIGYELNNGSWVRQPFYAFTPYSNSQLGLIDNVAKGICIGENPNQLFYLGTDNRVWVVYQSGAQWHSTAIDWRGNYAVRDLRIVNADNSSKRIYFVGSDDQIRYFNHGVCEILNPTCNGTDYLRGAQHDVSLSSPAAQEALKAADGQQKEQAVLSLFPNPATNEVQVALPRDVQDGSTLTVTNPSGKVVAQMRTLNAAAKVSLEGLPKGIYIVKVTSKAKVYVAKLVKE